MNNQLSFNLEVKEVALAYTVENTPIVREINEFSHAELIDSVLGLRKPIGQKLLNNFGGLVGLMQIDISELIGTFGLSKAGAIKLKAAVELGRQAQISEKNIIGKIIRSPGDISDFLKEKLRWNEVEQFVSIGLDSKNKIVYFDVISIGSLNASIVHPREVFNKAIKRRVASLIIAHQHPSGDPYPSNEDIDVTKRLVEAGRIIGIDVLDHLVIGDQSYISMKEKGYM